MLWALAAWRRFTARLARRGIAWQPWEGPLAFAERAARQAPVHAASIEAIAVLYARLRYGPAPQTSDLAVSYTHLDVYKRQALHCRHKETMRASR